MLQLTENISRLGTESAFEVLARAEALRQQGRDIINLGIGQPDFRTPDHIVEAAVKATTAIRQRRAYWRYAKRSPPTCNVLVALPSIPTELFVYPAAR